MDYALRLLRLAVDTHAITVNRMAFALAHELRPHDATAVALTPGWLRSEAMLDAYEVTEENWRYVPEVQDAGKPADTTGYR